jgi:hypothetical protein
MNAKKDYSLEDMPQGWWQMPNEKKRAAVADLAILLLTQIENEGRVPDPWETTNLLSALGALHTEFFSLARVQVILAMAPEIDRSPSWKPRLAMETPRACELISAFECILLQPSRPFRY